MAPVYKKCTPDGRSLMPWKFGDDVNEIKSMPTRALGGRLVRRIVGVGVNEADIGGWAIRLFVRMVGKLDREISR